MPSAKQVILFVIDGLRPDALQQAQELMARFEGLPVFIYHGEEDRNVSFEGAQQVAERLQAAGAKVEFHSEAGKGHEMPGEGAVRAYHDWLREVIRRR